VPEKQSTPKPPKPPKPTTVDEHLSYLTPEVREVMQRVRMILVSAIPNGEECISYSIPAIKLNGKMVVYFSGWAGHVSMYPIPPASDALTQKMQPYVAGKGTLKFPIDKPIPYLLIKQVAKAHLARVTQKAK
jgi:uncharacterized protein YdhG (YjbR/CyaY superfamily)